MSSPTNDITSPLLQLPGELRNHIYEFAPTTSRPLVTYISTGNRTRPVLYLPPDEKHPEIADHSITPPTTERSCDHDHQRHSYNQLKLANKQIFHETKGLELKFNCDASLFQRFSYLCVS
ncbi:hypothetical protein P171DRAFT_277164 [Karstenula rhodostoma CBS 690.94]|uniref:Uncharacterized protein n=1 Tax=Karstenula rhodostoma CBS 690.94 TaxID=1392251 RepID=A0A9P4PL13_9PLEO|nr:hypothetical protein P171DRAFT_277164 [Karstenula rhodostoma CBS 690.94]